MRQPVVGKVTCLVLRQAPDGLQLLTYLHPLGGYQIPAGTVEPGEPLPEAARRELIEETGLDCGLPLRHLGRQETVLEGVHFVCLRRMPMLSAPNLLAPPAAPFILTRGLYVEAQDQRNGFTLAAFVERDFTLPERPIRRRVDGWVPTENLGRRLVRDFFLFHAPSDGPDRWEVDGDLDHRFQPTWLPLQPPPPIVEPQRAWLDYLKHV